MRFVVGFCLLFLASLVLVLPLTVLLLFKLILIGIYCYREENEKKLVPLSALDTIFAVGPTWLKSVINVGLVLQLEGTLEVEALRKRFHECFLSEEHGERYDKLWSWIEMRGGYAFRAVSRKSLILEEQITERDLGNESLEGFLRKWIVEKYKEKKPCWEMVLLKSSKKTMCVVLKIHHSICDGYTLLHILDKLTGVNSPYLVKPFKETCLKEAKLMLEAPLSFGKAMDNGDKSKNPLKVSLTDNPEENLQQWMFSFTSLSMEEMKELRRRSNCRMIALIWALVGGAIRRFLVESGIEFPEFIGVSTTLPWPDHPAMVTTSKPPMCNHWTSGCFKIPLQTADPVGRLRKIDENITSFLTQGLDRFGTRIMNNMLWLFPASWLDRMISADMGIGGALTTIPAGNGYKLLGVPVKHIHALLIGLDNVPYCPISVYTISQGDYMEITLGANAQTILKNQETLDLICQKYLNEEFVNLSSSLTKCKKNE